MNLSFAKDSHIFSQSVEALRSTGVALTEGNIKAEYKRRGGEVPVEIETPVEDTPTVEEIATTVVEKPKRVRKATA